MRSKEWLEDVAGVQIPDSDTLHADACGPSYRYDSHTRLVLERKEDMTPARRAFARRMGRGGADFRRACRPGEFPAADRVSAAGDCVRGTLSANGYWVAP